MTQTAINRVKLAYQEQNSVCPPARGPPRITECWLSKYTGQEGTSVPLVCYVSELEKNVSLDAERLLRLLGVSGKLSGFHFAVYMLEQVQEKPEYVLLITKRLYIQTSKLRISPEPNRFLRRRIPRSFRRRRPRSEQLTDDRRGGTQLIELLIDLGRGHALRAVLQERRGQGRGMV